jgi:uncharacterized protein
MTTMPLESLLLAALAAGFFGSGHCVGMCGAVVSLLERPRLPDGNLSRRLAYNAGRLTCYCLLGTVAGAAGLVLTRIAGIGTALLLLRVLAAVLVILLALNLLFDLRSLRFVETAGFALWRRISPLARHVLPATSVPRAYGAGVIWGALPCGLVYAAVAMAAAGGTAIAGAAIMLAFWTGTLPALLLAGTAASRLGSLAGHTRFRRAGGVLLLLLGVLGLALPFRPMDHGAHGHPEPSVGAYP